MKKDEPEASVVVAEEEGSDDDEGCGAVPQLTAAGKPAAAAAAAAKQFRFPLPRPSSSPSPSPPSRSQIPASLRVSPARLQEALSSAASGPLAPTAATLRAVAADARLVALLDDAEVMASVSRVSRDPDLFPRELELLSRRGKARDLVELYRRMAAVAAKRCEAFCGDDEEEEEAEEAEEEEERKETEAKGTRAAEKKKKKKDEEGASSPPLLAGLCEQGGPKRCQQQQQQQSRAGIEVLR